MNTDPIGMIDCYSGEAPPRAKICLCSTFPAQKPARAVRAPGGCRIEFLPQDVSAHDVISAEIEKRKAIAVGCVPIRDSLTLWLSAPFSSFIKAKKVLPSLLDIALPFPLEKCVYQFLDIHRTQDKTVRALAIAARRDRIEELLAQYRSNGLDPELLDHEGLALWTQSLREIPMQSVSTRVLLHLSDSQATIIVGKNSRFASAHSIQAETGEKPDDTMIISIQRYLRAEIEPGTSVQWTLCGTGENSTFLKKLHEILSTEWPGPAIQHREPETFLLRAIGTRALRKEPLRCNLRCGSLTHPNRIRASQRQAVTGAILLLFAGLLLCIANAAWHIASNNRFTRTQQEIAALTKSIAPSERIPYGMEVAEIKKTMKRQLETIGPFLDAFEPSLSGRLADIAKAGQDRGLAFKTLSLQKDSVSITGTANDWDQCELFSQRLSAMGYTVALDRREALSDGPILFSLNGESTAR